MTTDDTLIEYRADTLGVISARRSPATRAALRLSARWPRTPMTFLAKTIAGWSSTSYPEKLIIRNNTHFRHIDFENINNIARGGSGLRTAARLARSAWASSRCTS